MTCAFNCKEHTAPVLPCWYCEGKDGDGQPYDPQVHHQWPCEACDERREWQEGRQNRIYHIENLEAQNLALIERNERLESENVNLREKLKQINLPDRTLEKRPPKLSTVERHRRSPNLKERVTGEPCAACAEAYSEKPNG